MVQAVLQHPIGRAAGALPTVIKANEFNPAAAASQEPLRPPLDLSVSVVVSSYVNLSDNATATARVQHPSIKTSQASHATPKIISMLAGKVQNELFADP